MLVRVYNYPWSGRLGRIAGRCICCGTKGPAFQVSSFGATCLGCRHKEPDPKRLAQFNAEYERLARAWCSKNGIDYDQTVKDMAEKYGGPPDQERPEVS